MANSNQPTLSKTCAACGLQKPLSAFLQLTDAGTSYGNICSTCRKAGADIKKPKTEAEDSTTSVSGHKIDTKTKIHGDIDKKQIKQRTEELYHEDRKKDEIIESIKIEKTESISDDEKKHRKEYLAKRSFISGTKATDKKTGTTQETERHQVAAAHEQQMETNKTENTVQAESTTREKQKIEEYDFSRFFFDSQVIGDIRKQGDVFLRFRKFVGNPNALIIRNLEKAAQGTDSKQVKPTEKEEKHVVEHPEKNTPGSKRRR